MLDQKSNSGITVHPYNREAQLSPIYYPKVELNPGFFVNPGVVNLGSMSELDMAAQSDANYSAVGRLASTYNFPDFALERFGLIVQVDPPIRESTWGQHNRRRLSSLTAAGTVTLSSLMSTTAFAQQNAPSSPDASEKIEVVVIGDSLTVGRVEAGNLVEEFLAHDVEITGLDYKGSRPFVLAACDLSTDNKDCVKVSDGIRALDRQAGHLATADAVFIALGTNDSLQNFAKSAERVIDRAFALTSTDGIPAPIVLPEMFYTKNGSAAEKNRILQEIATAKKAQGIEVVVLPYADKQIPLADGVHPSREGYKELVAIDIAGLLPIAQQANARTQNNTQSPPTTTVPVSSTPPRTNTPPDAAEDDFFGRVGVAFDDIFDGVSMARLDRTQVRIGDLLIPTTDLSKRELEKITVKDDILTVEEKTPKSEPNAMPTAVLAQEAVRVSELVSGMTISNVPVAEAPLAQADVARVFEISNNYQKNEEVSDQQEPIAQAPETTVYPPRMYTLNGNIVDNSKLIEHIKDTYLRADDERIPKGYVRMPDIAENYTFHNSVTDAERFISPEGAAYIIIISDKYAELRNKKYTDLPKKLVIGDLTSRHIEHQNGGDIDVLNLPNEAADLELYLFRTSLVYADGTPVLKHSITGNEDTKSNAEAYIDSLDLEGPNIIFKADHGSGFGNYNHTHDSLDGDSNGPFLLPMADIALNDNVPVAIEVPDVPEIDTSHDDEKNRQAKENETANDDDPPNDILIEQTPIDITQILLDWYNETAEFETSNTPEDPVVVVDDGDKGVESSEPKIDELGMDDIEEITAEEELPVAEPPITVPPDVITPTVPEVEPVDTEVTVPEVTPEQSQSIGQGSRLTFADITYIMPNAPLANVQKYAPYIIDAMAEFGIADEQMVCYAFATFAAESGALAPIEEYGKGKGKEYGKVIDTTGQAYYGRGFIQLTWLSNYEHQSAVLGVDLISNPDLLLDPAIASRSAALFLKENEQRIRDALNQGDLRKARQVVNGRAAHGLDVMSSAYERCVAVLQMKG